METVDRKKIISLFFKSFFIYFFLIFTFITHYYANKVKFNRRLDNYAIVKTKNIKLYNPLGYIKWRKIYKKATPKLIKKTDNYLILLCYSYLIIFFFFIAKKEKESVHGSARWATYPELEKMNLYAENGLVLGMDERNRILRDNSDKHVFFAAPTRGGKGINTVNTTSYDWTKSIVFNDIKGELWRDTSGYRKEVLGQKVFMFSPIDTDGVSCSYNPLDCVKIGTPHEFEDVQVITKTLLDTEGKGESDHWITSASNLLNAVVLHVKYATPNASLYDVASFLSPPDKKLVDVIADILGVKREDERTEVTLAMRVCAAHGDMNFDDKNTDYYWGNDDGSTGWKYQDESTFDHLKYQENKNLFREVYGYEGTPLDSKARLHPLVAKEFNSFFNTPDKERGSILSTATQKLKIFLDVIIASHIKHSDFTVKQLMDEKCSLYLVTPPKSIDRTRPLFRLIFTQIIFELTGRMKAPKKEIKEELTRKERLEKYIKKKKDNFINYLYANGESKKFKNQILLLIDEFPALGKLEVVEQGIPYIAGYGLKCLLIAQSLNQLKKVYGRDNSILDNCSIQLYLTPNENETAKAISDMFGSYTKKIYNETRKGIEFMASRSSSYVGRLLMRPEEVRTLPYNKILILVTGQNPIRGNKIFSYLHKRYKDNSKLYPSPETSDRCSISSILKEKKQENCESQNKAIQKEKATNNTNDSIETSKNDIFYEVEIDFNLSEHKNEVKKETLFDSIEKIMEEEVKIDNLEEQLKFKNVLSDEENKYQINYEKMILLINHDIKKNEKEYNINFSHDIKIE